MEQKFKEFKEFYEKNGGKLAGVHKGHKALKMPYVEDMRIVVGKTDKGKDEIVTGFCYSPTESCFCVARGGRFMLPSFC